MTWTIVCYDELRGFCGPTPMMSDPPPEPDPTGWYIAAGMFAVVVVLYVIASGYRRGGDDR